MQNKKHSSKSTGAETLWYNDKRFSAFWQQYNTMMMMAHRDAHARAAVVAQHTKDMLLSMHNPPRTHAPIQPARQQDTNSTCSRRRSTFKPWKQKRWNRRKRKTSKPCAILSDTDTLYSQLSQGMHIKDLSGDEEDMDISDDFLRFMEQSVRHRRAYKVHHKEQQQTPENKNPTHGHGTPSVPKEHPDIKRSREMQELYGEDSPRIHAMETALQLSFDRISTLHHPQYWPNIPLKMMFGDEL